MTTKNTFHNKIIKSSESKRAGYADWEMPYFGKSTKQVQTTEFSKDEFEKYRDEAIDEGRIAGYDRGYEEGKLKAYTEGKKLLDVRMKSFEELIACFNDPIRDFTEIVERQLMELLQVLFKVCLAKEMSIKPELIRKVIEDALKCLPINDEKKFIYLNPEDKKIFDDMWKESQTDLSEKYGQIVFNEFESLGRGEVLVRSKHSTIDATVEKRMMNILDKEVE